MIAEMFDYILSHSEPVRITCQTFQFHSFDREWDNAVVHIFDIKNPLYLIPKQ